jgi:hypothetical protein
MKFGVLSGKALQHPCDTALSVLLAPSSSGTALYLLEQSPGPPGPRSPNARMRAIVEHFERPPFAAPRDSRPWGAASIPIAIDENVHLPFLDTSIHLVVLSLTGSWLTSAQAQDQLFSEIRRVLVASGEVLILAMNRYGYSRPGEISPPDPERGTPNKIWALCHAFALLKNGAVLPSKRGLQCLLRRAGFKCVEWFRPLRDRGGCLAEIRPLRPRADLWSSYQSLGLKERIRHSSWFANEFVIRAAMEELEPSALQHCLEGAANQLGRRDASAKEIGIERLLVTPKEKLVVLAVLNDLPVVMRVPLSSSALEGCQRNMEALRFLSFEKTTGEVAPSPLADGYSAGYYCALESRISGQPLRKLSGPHPGLALVESLIRKLNPQPKVRECDDPVYRQLVSVPLAKITALIPTPQKREALELFFSTRLRGKQITVGITHGDLSLSNIFVEHNQVAGVIDWDQSCLNGFPILDAISNLCSRQFKRSGNFSETFLRLAKRQWPEPEELAFLDRCYKRFHIAPGNHSALVFLYWLNAVSSQLDFWFTRDSSFLRTRVYEVVDAITGKD